MGSQYVEKARQKQYLGSGRQLGELKHGQVLQATVGNGEIRRVGTEHILCQVHHIK